MNPHVNIHYRVQVTFVAASTTGTTTSTTTTVGSSHPFQLFRNNQYEDDTTSNSPHHYRKFRTTGPIVTITIPHDLTSINTEVNDDDDVMDDDKVPTISVSTTPSTLRKRGYNKSFWKTKIQRTKHQFQSILDTTLELLQPHCIYTIQTIPGQLPLPYWLPSLKSCTTRFQYATTASTTRSCTPTITTQRSSSRSHNGSIPTTRRSRSSRYSIEGLTKFEWNHKFFHQRNNVIQIAIQPYQEWITTTTTTRSTSNKQALSSSSILFHAKSGNANYAWLRCAISSSLPSLSNLDHAIPEATTLSSSNHYLQQQQQSSTRLSELIPQQQQSYEASMRASTKILVPMASISSIRMTPTLRWIEQRRWPLSTPPLSPQSTVSNAPPVTNAKQNRYYDTSCDVEVTSGGSGRTTATLTITPFSNMATMTGMTKKSIMTLAMEYRLSGGFNLLRRRPGKPGTGMNGMIASTTQQREHEQEQPQHWIRQIWEWRPPLGSSTTNVPIRFRPMSMANGIIASQYQWLILWPSGQSVRTIFDPPSHSDWNCQNGLVTNGGVTFTWTDPTNQNRWNPYDIEDDNDAHFSGDGTWITDIRIPFVRPTSDNITRRTKSLLWQNLFATEIRIRRQFRF